MDFIDHAINWCKGEIFEAKLILIFGLVVSVVAFLFWKVGFTPNAKGMLVPLLVIGMLFVVIGGGMLYSNPKRIIEFRTAYQENAQQFLLDEKARVEDFKSWYAMVRYIAAALGIVGLPVYLFWETSIGRAIGISLLLLVIATFVVDHFSEERADIYYEKIQKEILLK